MRPSSILPIASLSALVLFGCGERSAPKAAPEGSGTPAPAADPPATPAPAPRSDAAPGGLTTERIALARRAYGAGMCATCHGADASGSRAGPSLTDNEWVHCDGSVSGILAVLDSGVAESDFKNPAYPLAMPSAATLIPDADARLALAEYLWSLSHPAGR